MKTCLVKGCTAPATGDEDFPDEHPWTCRWHTPQYRMKREADMAACRAAGHPDVSTYPHGTFCRVCGRLPETVVELPGTEATS